MKVLIVGYGSIGRRHDEVLAKMGVFEDIHLVSRQKLEGRVVYRDLEDVADLDAYDYIVIASPTNKHFDQLKYIDSRVLRKKIFCEKPLFDTAREYVPRNNIFVGYVLRYHPLFDVLLDLLKDEKSIYVNVQVGSYLPSWRSNIDYRESYSAHKERGGGVLLDLSHEIDYLIWLFGMVDDLKSIQAKISDLDINSDDITTFVGRTENGVVINLSMDYISKLPFREIKIHTNQSTISVDMINNYITKYDKDGKIHKIVLPHVERNELFQRMHGDIMTSAKIACDYHEAFRVMKVIKKIQEQNNEA